MKDSRPAMSKDDLKLLERFVDKYGLAEVVDGLEDICFGKSDHIAHNWQDVLLAKEWLGAGSSFERVAREIRLRGTI